jgi:hypothetical protein
MVFFRYISVNTLRKGGNVITTTTIKCGLSEEPPVPYYKYEPQFMSENSNYKLYYDKSMVTDQTIHNNTLDTVMLEKPSKKHA